MALPVTIPNQFANATSSIPLSQLDGNFSTLANAVNGINSGSETLANLVATTANVTTGNITTVNATTVDTTNIEVTNIKAKDGTSAGSIANSTGVVTIASSVLTTTDINGGTIDATVIGGSNAAAITGTTITADTSVSTDTISEKTSAAGVTIDSVLLKDNKVTANELTINSNNISADNSLGFRNRIINGDMRIDQRNAGASVTVTTGVGTTYYLDRWVAFNNTNGTATIQQSTTAPTGFTNSIIYTVGTADTSIAAGQFATIRQPIEGLNVSDLAWGTANAKSVTLSFWVRSSATGTFCASFFNSSGARSYVATYTISTADTWEYKTITIAGDTSGTWLTTNGIGLYVSFALCSGTDFQTTSGSWQTFSFGFATSAQTNLFANSGATFYITGVQLEVGSVATPFERRPYGTELALCQRYYQSIPYIIWSGSATNGSAYYKDLVFPVVMRSAPTITWTNLGASSFPSSASTTNQTTTTQASWTRTANGTGTGAYFVDSMTLSAEL